MNEHLSQVTGGDWHPLVWLWGVGVGLLAWLDSSVLPHFVLWGSAGLVALGYWSKWRGRSKRDRSQDGTNY